MHLEQKIPKNPIIHNCTFCDYYTSSHKDFYKHKSTRKHVKREKENILEQNRTKNPEKSQKEFMCNNCDKQYLSRSGLWNHKKKCSLDKSSSHNITPALILDIVRQNQEMQNIILEQQ